MDLKLFLTVFGTVFLAELGDKTQIATLLFATRENAALCTVFAAASLALIAPPRWAFSPAQRFHSTSTRAYWAW